MKMTARPAARALANSSRTRPAPTPTYFSTNSEPETEKNGTSASAATAFASMVFPGTGRAIEHDAADGLGAKPHEAAGPEELDGLRQLQLRFVRSRDVGERDARAFAGDGLGPSDGGAGSPPRRSPAAGRRCRARDWSRSNHEDEHRDAEIARPMSAGRLATARPGSRAIASSVRRGGVARGADHVEGVADGDFRSDDVDRTAGRSRDEHGCRRARR